jgi:hypothetical protein
MNIGQLSLYAFAALSLVAVAWALSRWNKWFAISFFAALALGVATVVIYGTNVRKEHNQTMRFGTGEMGGVRVVTLKPQSGDDFHISDPAIVQKFGKAKAGFADVRWVGWYDFGRLKKHEIQDASPRP